MDLLLTTYENAGGATLSVVLHLLRRTCRLETTGLTIPMGQGTIACFWHQHVCSYFSTLVDNGTPFVSFLHPKSYLKPWDALARAEGWRTIVGSTGNGGRQAADQIVEYLRRGYSTFVCPDGPRGPSRVLKKGVLHMARKAGVPIVPMRFRCNRSLRLPSWDGKYIPLPYSTIEVTYGEPIHVVGEDLQASSERLKEALG